MEPHEKVYRGRKAIIFNNFIAGIAWAIGVTVGFALIIGLFSFVLKNVNFVPYIGGFISDVIKLIIKSNPQWTR